MMKTLTNELKERIFNKVKDTKYAGLIVPELEANNINKIRVLLSDYLDEVTPEIRPLFNSDNVNKWNHEVTTYQKVYEVYNLVVDLFIEEILEPEFIEVTNKP